MTRLPSGHPFRRHAQNLAAVKKGLVQLERQHRAAIRKGDAAAVDILARLHALTVGLMAEARLRKIIFDPDGFNDRERDLLLRTRTQVERWHFSVEYAFRRHYSVLIHQDLDQFTLGATEFAQFTAVNALLDGHLADVIGDRNKTAHAQWAWHLNSNETAFTGPAPHTLNYRAIKTRSDLILRIGDLVHALTVSEPTFQRDYAVITGEINRLAPLTDGHDYASYVAQLRG